MKKATKVGKIGCTLKKVRDFWDRNSNKIKPIILVFCLLITIPTTIILVHNMYEEGFKGMYAYPREKYQALEKEAEKIVVDGLYIDMEKISDKQIEYTNEYYKPDENSNGSWKIVLKKDGVDVVAKVNKSYENGRLNMEISYQQKNFFTTERTFALILLTALVFAIWIFIIIISFCVITGIFFLLVGIEKIVLFFKRT